MDHIRSLHSVPNWDEGSFARGDRLFVEYEWDSVTRRAPFVGVHSALAPRSGKQLGIWLAELVGVSFETESRKQKAQKRF